MTVQKIALTEPLQTVSGGLQPEYDTPVRVRVTNDLRDLAGIWPRSHDEGPGRCYAFQCADVLEAWCNTIGAARNTSPFFVTVTDESDRSLLLLPLGLERRHGVRVLSFLDGGVADYNAPVVFPGAEQLSESAIRLVWKLLRDTLPPFDLAVFDKMPEQVAGLRNPLSVLATSRYPNSGHAMTLSGTWTEYSKNRLPRRQDSGRKRRRLEKLGTLKFEIAETPEHADIFLEAMIRQKTRRFRETGAADDFKRPGYRAFFPEITRRSGSQGPVHLSVLKLDDEILAAHWGYVAGKRFYYLMPSFEGGNWNRYSAGRLHLEALLAWFFDQGIEFFDFGIGDDSYKSEFSDFSIPLYCALMPVTAAGRVYTNVLSAKMRLQKSKAWPVLRRYLTRR